MKLKKINVGFRNPFQLCFLFIYLCLNYYHYFPTESWLQKKQKKKHTCLDTGLDTWREPKKLTLKKFDPLEINAQPLLVRIVSALVKLSAALEFEISFQEKALRLLCKTDSWHKLILIMSVSCLCL